MLQVRFLFSLYAELQSYSHRSWKWKGLFNYSVGINFFFLLLLPLYVYKLQQSSWISYCMYSSVIIHFDHFDFILVMVISTLDNWKTYCQLRDVLLKCRWCTDIYEKCARCLNAIAMNTNEPNLAGITACQENEI